MKPVLAAWLPFLRWPAPNAGSVRADFVAGLTVALVLVPQSMAYAQLAGMPPYYGLYAGFLPAVIGALWGSSSQLATGPVAVASLLTASALAPLAAGGTEAYVALAIGLALLVGVFQLVLGVFRLGVVVNFLSHPVIVGFTNAAAIIIGLSQLNKLIGVPMPRTEHFIADVWNVLLQIGDTHWPTLAMGVGAIAVMTVLRRLAPRAPGVLVAVAIATVVSWSVGFERNAAVSLAQIEAPEAVMLLAEYASAQQKIEELNARIASGGAALAAARKAGADGAHAALTLNYEIDVLRLQLKDREAENRVRNRALRSMSLARLPGTAGAADRFVDAAAAPARGTDGHRWRIARAPGAPGGEVRLVGGGEVVGKVPEGLPTVALPAISWDSLRALLSAAVVISLVAFMEAISIAKAMAAKTRQRIDPNQELMGQGLANLASALTQGFPVSGSFSRSAVNLNAGAASGLSAVFTGLFVLLTLLFLTPLLYHLPQAVLAAVIIMAVVGLVNFGAIRHAWQASRHDGIAAIVTFAATLAFAPHLDTGILVGAAVAIALYLFRTMRPRVAILGRHADGTLRDVKVHNLPTSEIVTAVRFDGRLYFANVSYFEDAILEAVAGNPKARTLLIVGDGINELDASGEEVMHHVIRRLREGGVDVVFSGLKKQVLDVMRATGLLTWLGEDKIFSTYDQALEAIYANYSGGGTALAPQSCPLMPQRWGGNAAR